MKITNRFLHLPPFISTPWINVSTLYMKELALIVVLNDNSQVAVPNLTQEIVEEIFNAYAAFLETEKQAIPHKGQFVIQSQSSTGPVKGQGKLNFNTLDASGMVMQHNPQEANTPEFPPEVLEKITAIAKIVAPDDVKSIPEAVDLCNCPHCQIARAIRKSLGIIEAKVEVEQTEEIIKDQDLAFQQWTIKQSGENLFDVTNKLDINEVYHVFLGNPVGCTCGKSGCEHMLAVLKS